MLGLGAAAWFSILLARADAEFRAATPESVARATRLTPLNTAYLSLRALQVEYSGGDPRPLFEEIARINPNASAPRIRLGLDAEARGDLAAAERWLLDAARVDRQYEPRWTLANFYFRQQRMDDLWKWIHAALEVSYGDRRAAFDLCWQASSDAALILARAIPDQHDVLAAYLGYLEQHHAGEVGPVAIRLSQARDPGDAALADGALDSLVRAGDRTAAREIWRNFGYPDPPPVMNPDFGPPRVGHGFDWRLSPNAGVTFTPLDTPPALRVSFNGMQPESCELLRQYAGIQTGKRYLLRWESRGIGSGIAWRAGSATGPLSAATVWTPGQLAFLAGSDGGVIALFYKRPLGEPRVEGSVELRHVSLEEQLR